MVARAYAEAEQLAEVNKTTTGFTDVVALTHTPADNSTWVYLATADTGSNSAIDDVQIRAIHDTDTTVFAACNFELQEATSPEDKFSFNGFYVKAYGASPGSQTISIEYGAEVSGRTVRALNARVVGFALHTNDSSVAGSTTDNTTTDATNWTDLTSASLTLNLSGESGATNWIILASAEYISNSTSVVAQLRVDVDGTPQAQHNNSPQDTTNYCSFGWLENLSLSAASHTIKIQVRSGSAGTQVGARRGKLLALKVTDLENVYYAESRTRGSGTDTTYTTHQSYNPTIAAAVDHLIIGSYWKDVSSTTISGYATLTNGSLTYCEDINEANAANNDYGRFVADVATLASGAGVTWSVQRKSETSSVTVGIEESAICIIQLQSAASASLLIPPPMPAFMAAALMR